MLQGLETSLQRQESQSKGMLLGMYRTHPGSLMLKMLLILASF